MHLIFPETKHRDRTHFRVDAYGIYLYATGVRMWQGEMREITLAGLSFQWSKKDNRRAGFFHFDHRHTFPDPKT